MVNLRCVVIHGLPEPKAPREIAVDPVLEINHAEAQAQETLWRDSYTSFNEDQRNVFDHIDRALQSRIASIFLLML